LNGFANEEKKKTLVEYVSKCKRAAIWDTEEDVRLVFKIKAIGFRQVFIKHLGLPFSRWFTLCPIKYN
jgi:hypothetical protein